MVLKKYKCNARKRMFIWAKNWLEANEKFAKWMADNEIETQVELWTAKDTLKEFQYQETYKRRHKK